MQFELWQLFIVGVLYLGLLFVIATDRAQPLQVGQALQGVVAIHPQPADRGQLGQRAVKQAVGSKRWAALC